MTVLKKAVLIDYTKLKTMIDQGTIDGETVYFLSGKDLHDKIKDIDTKIESKADQTSIPNISNLATKQEVTDAVAGVQVPSIEGLAKTTDVESTYAKKPNSNILQLVRVLLYLKLVLSLRLLLK